MYTRVNYVRLTALGNAQASLPHWPPVPVLLPSFSSLLPTPPTTMSLPLTFSSGYPLLSHTYLLSLVYHTSLQWVQAVKQQVKQLEARREQVGRTAPCT